MILVNFIGLDQNLFLNKKNLFKSKAYGLRLPYKFSYDINNKIDLKFQK